MTNVAFGLPQILSSFLMIIICCFTDCAAATALAYEAPEADVLSRPPRNAKKDRLVNWKLVLQAYGFIGILEAVSSFAMSYWYAQRAGIPFSKLWFGFGAVPEGMTSERYADILNTASSVYFINLVVMQWVCHLVEILLEISANDFSVRSLRRPNAPPFCPATQHELVALPSDHLRFGDRDLLHIRAKVPQRAANRYRASSTLVLTFCFWNGDSVAG